MTRTSCALALTWVLGCTPRQRTSDEFSRTTTMDISSSKDLDIKSNMWDISGTEPSKTIHPNPENTVEGTRYMGGAIRIDKIVLQEGWGVLSANVRIANTRYEKISGEYRIEFRDANGRLIMGQKPDWSPFTLGPNELLMLSNSALVAGATTFKLLVGPVGSSKTNP